MNNSSLLRNAFNAVAYASVFAHWAAHAICLGIALPRAGVTGGVFYGAFAAGGCLAVVSNRFFGRLSSNVAISILAAIATVGAALAHVALNAESVARIPLLLGLVLSGCGVMSLIAHLNARILRDASDAKRVPLIASAGTVAWIAVNWTINSEGTNFFLWSTLATGALSIFALIGPRSCAVEAETTAKSDSDAATPTVRSIIARNPSIFATLFLANAVNTTLLFSIFGIYVNSIAATYTYNFDVSPTRISVLFQASEVLTILGLTALIRWCGGLKRALAFALFATSSRYFIFGFCPSIYGIIGGAVLHGVAFVGLSSILPLLYVDKFYRESERKTAQATLTTCTMAAPSIIAGFVSSALQIWATGETGIDWARFFLPPALLLMLLGVFWCWKGASVDANSSADNAETSENADAA